MHPRRSLPGPRHSRRRNQGSDEKSPVGRFRDDDPGPLGQGRRCCQQEMAVHGYGGLEGESCLIQKGPFPFRVSALTPSHFPSIRRSPRPCITAFASSSSRFFLRLCVFFSGLYSEKPRTEQGSLHHFFPSFYPDIMRMSIRVRNWRFVFRFMEPVIASLAWAPSCRFFSVILS